MSVCVCVWACVCVCERERVTAPELPARDATNCVQQRGPGMVLEAACRPRPWWTCSHGELIHDVTAEGCRWRAEREVSNQPAAAVFTRLLGGCSDPITSAQRWCFFKSWGFEGDVPQTCFI